MNEQDDLSKIDTLYSHPQVIQQCSQFIQSLERVHIEYCESSSHAMQLVASLNKPNIAALGNEDGGKLYGLHVDGYKVYQFCLKSSCSFTKT